MSIAVDYTARIPPEALRNAGVSGVLRYLCYEPVGTWKVIKQPEYDELIGAGFDVTLNWEYDARDWLSVNGTSHGNTAVMQARRLGYPIGCTIYGSCDFDMNYTQWLNAGRAYAKAFAKAIRDGGYRPGVYGPFDVLTWVRAETIMDRFWQAGMSTAWSGGRNANVFIGAHLRQRRKIAIGNQETDWNDILIPEWGQARKDTSMVDANGNTWGQMGPPVPNDYFDVRGPSVALADLIGQEFQGHSLYDGHTQSVRTVLLNQIKAGIDALTANPPVPASTVTLAQEDRDRIDRLTAVLTEVAAHVK